MLKRSFGYRWIITALVISFALARTQVGFGSSFEVSPIRVSLVPNESSTLMTVRNEGEERLRLQISVMAWDQSKGGEMVLKPTDDIIFYPSLLTVDPGGQRNLRVGSNGAVVAKEQTYRIFVEELVRLRRTCHWSWTKSATTLFESLMNGSPVPWR